MRLVQMDKITAQNNLYKKLFNHSDFITQEILYIRLPPFSCVKKIKMNEIKTVN
jgi:hypothetical protein